MIDGITVEAAALRLGITKDTVRRAVKDGILEINYTGANSGPYKQYLIKEGSLKNYKNTRRRRQ